MTDNHLAEKEIPGTLEKQPREVTVGLQDAAVQLGIIRFGIMPTLTLNGANSSPWSGRTVREKHPFPCAAGDANFQSGQVMVLGETPRRGNQTIGYVPQRRWFDPDVDFAAAMSFIYDY